MILSKSPREAIHPLRIGHVSVSYSSYSSLENSFYIQADKNRLPLSPGSHPLFLQWSWRFRHLEINNLRFQVQYDRWFRLAKT